MRKQILLTLLLILPFMVGATVLTPQEALNRVNSSSARRAPAMSKQQPKLIKTVRDKSGDAAVYLFSTTGGTLVLSADDAAPAVLGYTDGAMDEIPANMQAWLAMYADEIEWLRANGAPQQVAVVRPERAPIAPLVTTLWGQAEPYNNFCPVDPSSSKGAKCVTGCVATAMAQVINWHKWPIQGRGSHSYAWNEQSLSFNYAETTFDYDNMVDVYKDVETTQAQQDAVATLMSACGIGIDMQYSSGSSGAYGNEVPIPIYKYFCYDEHVNYASRDYYGKYDWEELIYDQLEKVGPVMVSGTSSGGGHEFVCDGYSEDGYFHFNWGWNGLSDGYFLFTTLNPTSQGIGGGSDSGFTYNMGAVVNMSKDYIPGLKASVWRCKNEAKVTSSATLGGTVQLECRMINQGFREASPTLGLAVLNEDGSLDVIASATSTHTYANLDDYKDKVTLTLPAAYQNGTYTVVPTVRDDDGVWRRLPVAQTSVGSFTMNVNGNSVTFADQNPPETKTRVAMTAVEYLEKPQANGEVKMKLTITNSTPSFWEHPLYVGVLYPEGHPTTGIIAMSEDLRLEFEGNQTHEVECTLNVSKLGTGDYRLGLYTHNLLLVQFYNLCGDYFDLHLWGADPTSFSIEGETINIAPGSEISIPVVATPEGADMTATWTSSNTSVATVDNQGTVTGVGYGTAVITVTTFNGITSSRTIEVCDNPVRPFPATVNGVIYDYADDAHTTLMAKANVTRALKNRYVVLESEIDGIPVTEVGESFITAIGDCPITLVIPEGYTKLGNNALNGAYIYNLYLPSTLTTLGTNSLKLTAIYKVINHASRLALKDGGFPDTSSRSVYVKSAEDAVGLTKSKIYERPRLDEIFFDGKYIFVPTSDSTCELLGTTVDATSGVLTNIDIPEAVMYSDKYLAVTAISDRAFYYYTYVTTASIPQTVNWIGSDIFPLNKLADVFCYIAGPDKVTTASNAFAKSALYDNKATLHVYNQYVDAFSAAEAWSGFPAIVGMEGVAGPKINVDPANLIMRVGDTKKVNAVGSPIYYFTEDFEWTTSNPAIVSVDTEGIATANAIGTAVLTVSANGCSTDVEVKVIPAITMEFPVTIDNIVYDFADDNQVSLAVTGFTGSLSSYYAYIKDELDNLPVVKIGPAAFRGKYIRYVEIPETVTEICDSAFMSASIQAIRIPAGVKKLGYRALYNTNQLRKIFCLSSTNLNFKNAGLTASDPYVIYTKSAPVTMEFYEDKYEVMPCLDEMFTDANSLIYVPIDENYCKLVHYIYRKTPANVDIPQVVSSDGDNYIVSGIGRYALQNNPTVTSVRIPINVTEIGLNAFAKCTALKAVTCDVHSPMLIECGAGMFDDVSVAAATLTVPHGAGDLYRTAAQWQDFGQIVESLMVGIEEAGADRALAINGNAIVIAAGHEGMVTDLAGHVLYRGAGEFKASAPGLYLVTVDGVTTKVLIK